jgi:hypothetical protein
MRVLRVKADRGGQRMTCKTVVLGQAYSKTSESTQNMIGISSCASALLRWVGDQYRCYSEFYIQLISAEIPLADSGSLTTGPSADNQAGFEIERLPNPAWRVGRFSVFTKGLSLICF